MRFEAEMLCLKSQSKLFNFTLKLNLRALLDPLCKEGQPLCFNFTYRLNALDYGGVGASVRSGGPEFNLQVKLNEKRGYIPGTFPSFRTINFSTKMSSTVSSTLSLLVAKVDAQTALINALQAEMTALRSAPVKTVSAVSAGKPVTEKKPRKKSDAPPTPWRLFTDRVRSVLAGAEFKGTALGVECVQFCATLKDENADFDSWTPELILARRADWTKPEVSRGEAKHGKGWAKTGERRAAAKTSSAGNSVVSAPAEDEDGELFDDEPVGSAPAKTGRKWSPEAKAAAAAKRAAKKAVASAVVSADGESAPAVKDAPSPKLSASSSSSNAANVGVAAASASSSGAVFKPVMLGGGARYFVNMENGHAYHRLADGSQGEWAGLFKRDPKPRIDDSVPEPSADGELCFDE